MKKTYESPEMELIETDGKDIITSSTDDGSVKLPTAPL